MLGVAGNVNWHAHYGKQQTFLKTELTYGASNLSIDLHPEEEKSKCRGDMGTPMLITALLTTSKTWNELSTDKEMS